MKDKISEILATAITAAGIIAALFWPFSYEAQVVHRGLPPGAQVITLTGVAATGTWTDQDVTGSNYWRADFRPARPVLRVGRPALLRLKSADVLHTFYSPELGIGPIEIHPGYVEEVLLTPEREGVFEFYCLTVCGEPHFGMRGVIIVEASGHTPPAVDFPRTDRYWLEPPPPEGSGIVERGEWLFRRNGCFTCHGPEGRGGVRNANYVKDTVPALNTLRRKLFLPFDEDVEAIIRALEEGRSLERLEDDPPVRRFSWVLAQYEAVREVIRNGNPPGKKDPEGPAPPLEMPSWRYRLTDEDIDAIIAYLLSLKPPEEGEGG